MALRKLAATVAKDGNPDKYDRRVLSLAQWAENNGFSLATARRILDRGEGPPTIETSQRRRGIRVCDDYKWQESRIRQTERA